MDFIVSRKFTKWREINTLGDRYVRSLPVWAQSAPAGEVTVIIAPSTQNAEDTLLSVRNRIQGKTLRIVFSRSISEGYKDFFAEYVKRVIHSDPTLNAVFLRYVREITVPGIFSCDVAEQLFRHLAWYFISSSTLLSYNHDCFHLCRKIANELMFVGLSQGTLQ